MTILTLTFRVIFVIKWIGEGSTYLVATPSLILKLKVNSTQNYDKECSTLFSSSYQLRLSEYILLLELPTFTFFSHFCFFCFFFLLYLILPYNCVLSTPCAPSLVSHLLVSRRSNKTHKKNLVKSQRTKLRIIRIEYELNSTNNWELNLTREPQRNWIRLFPLRRLWMLRPLKKRPALPGKVHWRNDNLRPHWCRSVNSSSVKRRSTQICLKMKFAMTTRSLR